MLCVLTEKIKIKKPAAANGLIMRGNTHTHEKSLSGTLGEPQLFFSSFLLRSNLVKKKMLIVRRRRKNSFVAIMCRLLKHNEKKERDTRRQCNNFSPSFSVG